MLTPSLFFATHLKKIVKNLLLALAIVVSVAPASFAASFNCSIATRPIEKTICSDIELSSLDERLNQSYQTALAKNPEIKFSQREWLKALNECNVDASPIECLRNAFKARIKTLNQATTANAGTLGIEILGLYKINNQNGLQVGAVNPNSSGYNAGILSGDFIVEINNNKIEDINQAMNQLSVLPGQTVLLKIIKKDNSERVVQVIIGNKVEAPTPPENGTPVIPATTADQPQSSPAAIESQPPPEKNIVNQKNEFSSDTKNSGSSSWFITLLLALGGVYYWKKKNGQKIPAQPEQNTKSGYKEPPASTRQSEVKMEAKKMTKKPPTKEELLKQQQMNAFKKLK